MSQQTVARRYAQALAEQAEASGVTEKVDADVKVIRDAMAESRELRNLFRSPVVPREKKRAAARALFEEHVQELTIRFIEMLIDKRREGLFTDIAAAYESLRDVEMGIIGVSVRSARPLDAEAEQAVSRRIEQMTGKRVRLDASVDESLMGGLVVRVGDTVYDGSISNRLDDLRERLIHGNTTSD